MTSRRSMASTSRSPSACTGSSPPRPKRRRPRRARRRRAGPSWTAALRRKPVRATALSCAIATTWPSTPPPPSSKKWKRTKSKNRWSPTRRRIATRDPRTAADPTRAGTVNRLPQRTVFPCSSGPTCPTRAPRSRRERTAAMKLYPKIIPAIARDVIATLMAVGDVEVETMRVADAEMDMAAILKEYLASEERVNQATREALERRGYDHSRFNQVKREMADVRGFKMGDEGIDYIINQMIEFLLISRNIEEVFAEDHTIRRKIYQVFKKHLDVDEDIDREARSRLKHLSEGTQAWEVEYQKTVEQIRRNKGLRSE